ncbi:hypothetical protein F0L68_02505 [Solihabitans fulvus]|uniref:Uncharacterized protein n=1 Tax=Solihabitans fulvus TaxID=1892852 RepID=A0A5B2XQR8_9PSEU|nr:hypothetical protein [Solihabitans fulvus]KAA2266017.1 hypothetical protein F0L68_02505 [Solihabitans fulvus]
MDKRPAGSAEQARPARGLAGHCARAAAVGGVLGLAVTVFASTIPGNEELGALGEVAVAVLAAWALSWPLLLVARVRQPWLTALLAPVALVALAQGMSMLAPYTSVLDQWQQAATVIAVTVVAAGGYAAAAFVGGPGARPRWRIIVAVGVVALIPAQMVVGPMQQTAREADQATREAARQAAQLAAFQYPLFAPDLPDYTIIEYNADSGSSFAFWLRPKSARQQADESLNIGVFQTPAPARFNPPADCATPDLSNGGAALPCVTVAPDVWRVDKPPNGRAPLYLVRRGDRLIQISTGSAAIPERDLARAATTLRQQPPSYFRADPSPR